MTLKVIKSSFGYFENQRDQKPTYDPGLDIECLACGKTLSRPLKTISFVALDDNVERSYFYRVHDECATEENQSKIEGLIIK